MTFLKKDEVIFEKFFLLKDKKSFKKSLILLDQLNKTYPKNNIIYGLYGTIYYELKDYKNSCKYYKLVTSINPKSEVASLGLFHSYIHLGKENLALNELNRFCNIAKPESYLLTIEELKQNVDKYKSEDQIEIIQNLYNKWINKLKVLKQH